MNRRNLFDTATPEVQRNTVKDVAKMAQTECHVDRLPDGAAERIARAILSRARERDSLYRVSTARLCRLVNKELFR